MQAHRLHAHPAHPPKAVTAVEAKITGLDANWLQLRWRIEDASQLVLPSFAGKGRAGGLWRTTCFELFARHGSGHRYIEFNLSPSERWNAYSFDDYREGMAEWAMPQDAVSTIRPGSKFAIFEASIPSRALPDLPTSIGLSAVIEERCGAKSYWALAHPDDERPDFHHPACFAARLEAPQHP